MIKVSARWPVFFPKAGHANEEQFILELLTNDVQKGLTLFASNNIEGSLQGGFDLIRVLRAFSISAKCLADFFITGLRCQITERKIVRACGPTIRVKHPGSPPYGLPFLVIKDTV